MGTWSHDFREFFESLNTRGVEYVIIGGAAYNHHAPPRATKDIDVWVRGVPDNAERLIDAIEAFGFPAIGVDAETLAAEPRVLMLGRAPYRIDILTQVDGIVWEAARPRAVDANYDGVPVSFLSLEDLIAAKRASGRPRDLADLLVLETIAAQED